MLYMPYWPQTAKIVLKLKIVRKLKVVCQRFVQIYIIWEKVSYWRKFLWRQFFSAVEEPLDCLVGVYQVWSQIKTPNCKDTINSFQNKLFLTKPCLLLSWKAFQCVAISLVKRLLDQSNISLIADVSVSLIGWENSSRVLS